MCDTDHQFLSPDIKCHCNEKSLILVFSDKPEWRFTFFDISVSLDVIYTHEYVNYILFYKMMNIFVNNEQNPLKHCKSIAIC